MDTTETDRREQVQGINSKVKSSDKIDERERLEKEYGHVWNIGEVSNDFNIVGFMAPYVVVIRKIDGVKGSLQFQHSPRLYFNFEVD